MGKKRRHRTLYERETRKIDTEGQKQCFLAYSAIAIALSRHWGKGQITIQRLFEVSREVWNECTEREDKSMIGMLEKETGIEVQNGTGKSWHNLLYLNGEIQGRALTHAQMTYMRQRQVKWIAAQVTACLLVALHRKYGFGFDRCEKVYQQMQEIQAEYSHDPDRIQKACWAETLVNVKDIITETRDKSEST